ncbi:MAG TPA: radical SAM protein [Chitinivibrionales bacterium]|nr:radical SAM protein [Chitinivibrionales bacterium]
MNALRKKSVVFIEPSGAVANVFEDFMKLPLTGTLYLGTILHNAGYDVRIYNESVLPERIDPFTIHADVFCISSLTTSATRAKALANQIRRIYPESRIIVGGIHASLVPEDFQDTADCIVQGEAEKNIIDIVEGKYAEKIVQGEAIDDVEQLPLINYSLIQGVDSMDIIPIMTSRGCPFDCNFCCVTKVFGKHFRFQSPQRIIDEVKHALTFFKTNSVFFYDDNFTANQRRIDELCDLILAQDIDITWTAQVRQDIARNPALLRKMEKAGCRIVFIGFESINDLALKAMHKSQTRADIENAINVLHDCGINIHGMFIFGDDNDTVEILRQTVDFAIDRHIDTVQFTILTPFPGTPVYNAMVSQKRLFHRRWENYNGMYIVYQPKTMTAVQLQKEMINAYHKFYSLRRLLLEGLKLVLNVVIDALVWDFRRVFRFSFETLIVKGGFRFLVSRLASTYDSYFAFLENIDMPPLDAKRGNP